MTISIIILCILYIVECVRRPVSVSPFQNAVICRGIVVDTLQTKADVGHAPYLLTTESCMAFWAQVAPSDQRLYRP